MKTKKMIVAGAILLAGSFTMGLQAQEHLNALAKKCESMDKVDMDIIYYKNKETKKIERIVRSFEFTDTQLLNEFLAAFEKDKETAYKVMEAKKNGKIMPSLYRFSTGTTDRVYSLDISKTGKTSISVIERFNIDPKTLNPNAGEG